MKGECNKNRKLAMAVNAGEQKVGRYCVRRKRVWKWWMRGDSKGWCGGGMRGDSKGWCGGDEG